MPFRPIRTFCELSTDSERLLERAMTEQGLIARPDHILKVARTVAEIEETANIEPKHIAEAIQYPSLDRTYERSPRQLASSAQTSHPARRNNLLLSPPGGHYRRVSRFMPLIFLSRSLPQGAP